MGQVRNPPTTLHQLEKTLQECQEVRGWTRTLVQRVAESHRREQGERSFQPSNEPSVRRRLTRFCPSSSSSSTGGCISPFAELTGRFQRYVSEQTWSWEEQLKFGPLFKFLQRQEGNIGAGATMDRWLKLGTDHWGGRLARPVGAEMRLRPTSSRRIQPCFTSKKNY